MGIVRWRHARNAPDDCRRSLNPVCQSRKSRATQWISSNWVNAVATALTEAFNMAWEVFWPLILGFALSGAVQAVVSH